jgi:hypothetical protein
VTLTWIDRELTPFVIESRPWQHHEAERAAAEATEDAVQKAATISMPIARAVETMRKTRNDRRKAYTHPDRDEDGARMRRTTTAIRKSAHPL